LLRARPSVLFVHTQLSPRGGAEVVAAWMLEALKGRYDVTALTWSKPDLAGLNLMCGTTLTETDIRLITPSRAARRIAGLVPDAAGTWQKRSWLMRMAKRVVHNYDVPLACTSEFDFGRPGIQYVHHPWMAPSYRRIARGSRRLVPALGRGVYRVAGFRFASMLENLTLVNSEWTGAEYRRAYERPADTVYPPVAGSFRETPWRDRRDAFVIVARLEPDKNHLRALEVVKAVKRRHDRLELHIVGIGHRTVGGRQYVRRLRSRLAGEGSWVTLHEDLPRDELLHLLSQVRYGIHLREDEHFGIAAAEMARAGVIPFVHDSGGQVETVEHPALRFRSDAEAVERIDLVLCNARLREEICIRLRERSRRFSPECFREQLLARVEAWRARVLPCEGSAL
jgi:glycosyltransferase involved in cell wall biosynthesis